MDIASYPLSDPLQIQGYILNCQHHGIVSSMSGVGSCYDTAVAESFFGLLTRERDSRRTDRTRAEARVRCVWLHRAVLQSAAQSLLFGRLVTGQIC